MLQPEHEDSFPVSKWPSICLTIALIAVASGANPCWAYVGELNAGAFRG
jgi:hypothetical protein